jgi:ATP adenylyltransferase
MKILWAPWRMDYIAASNEKGGCIFCPGDDRSHDEERLILHAGDQSIVLMNRYPYINGHLLVAPVRHVSALDALTDDEKLDLITMVEKSVEILTKAMNPGGFNVGVNLGRIAGAGVEEHIHFHVVPRWSGDTNYMTVVGDVRVIPEHIQATYEKLLPLFKGL